MASRDNDIPTLTQVVHHGDDSMLNHFDSHQLAGNTDSDAESKLKVENATDIENLVLKDMPSIKAQPLNSNDIPEHDFTAAMEPALQKTASGTNTEKLKKEINLAISEALPGIEAHLKKTLYKKLGIK